MKTVSWFSAGVDSAIATKLLIDEVDEIYYIHINDQHEDTMRFVKECEQWFGKPVKMMQSNKYSDVESTLRAASYINGVAGAPCTKFLKRRVRMEWEVDQKEKLRYVWGFDCTEQHRADRLYETMPQCEHVFPLIDQSISKQHAHQILKASGIKRPFMYDRYENNNCVGCVKGGKNYWGRIRKDFPEVFKSRSELERTIGASCINGTFLDELPERFDGKAKPICDDCGIFCELMGL